MTRVYYKYAHGALIVFDLARPETFDAALSWLSDVTEKLFDEKKELLAGRDFLIISSKNCVIDILHHCYNFSVPIDYLLTLLLQINLVETGVNEVKVQPVLHPPKKLIGQCQSF